MTGTQAVAISTTGHDHRLGFLETSVRMWEDALGYWPGDLFVTVDGSEADAAKVAEVLRYSSAEVYRVGRPEFSGDMDNSHRLGVAVNKNTGLELMMDQSRADHLFLCDDDTAPRSKIALRKHTEISPSIPHSMVCWGAHRLLAEKDEAPRSHAEWSWPRGVLLYTHRLVVEQVGGMDEAMGTGGHEHAEWSRRIHQHGFTPAPYCSPLVYAMYSVAGSAQRADRFWLCEDMRRIGETSVELGHRRKAQTTIAKSVTNWERANEAMTARDGNTLYVPFRAHENGRASATLCSTSTGLGAGGDL